MTRFSPLDDFTNALMAEMAARTAKDDAYAALNAPRNRKIRTSLRAMADAADTRLREARETATTTYDAMTPGDQLTADELFGEFY